MAETSLTVRARDGYPLAADLLEPAGPPRGAVLLAPAMGVPRRFYRPFAAHLASRGLAALAVDVRGVGGSRPPRLRGFPATLAGWGELDLAGGLDALGARYPGAPLLWVGHSAGGQLLGLVEDARLAGAILVGAQNGHWRLWPGLAARLGMFALWHAVIPLLVPAFGYLPMRLLGQGEDVPAGVALQWAEWGRRRAYVHSYAAPRGGLAFASYAGPLRAYAVTDDAFAPPASVDALVGCYARARTETRRVAPAELGVAAIGHFGFFRPRFEATLWREAADWLLAAAAARAAGEPGAPRAPGPA